MLRVLRGRHLLALLDPHVARDIFILRSLFYLVLSLSGHVALDSSDPVF